MLHIHQSLKNVFPRRLDGPDSLCSAALAVSAAAVALKLHCHADYSAIGMRHAKVKGVCKNSSARHALLSTFS